MKTFIIAEAGVNHNGDMDLAKKLVDIAKEAGADAVKFQTFKSEQVISTFAEKAEYQKENTGNNESQLDMVKKLELSFDDFKNLKKYCEIKNIQFLSTPFDFESADFLIDEMNLPIIKIPSGEITNAPFLLDIARKKTKIILSTGMSTLSEIQQALSVIAFGLLDTSAMPSIQKFEDVFISEEGQQVLKEYVTLLHCTTEYPAPVEDVNLRAMDTIKSAFGLPVGYSDHTEGISISVAAVALGATIIEKHITYDKHADGPDHIASLEPNELKDLVTAIRAVEKSLGNGIKIPSKSELKNKNIARKSIVAKFEIKADDIFTNVNLAIKRPGSGISPFEYWEVLGKVALRDFQQDEEID